MIVSWSPVCNMIRYLNTGIIRIPIGMFKDFKITKVKIVNDEIVISLSRDFFTNSE